MSEHDVLFEKISARLQDLATTIADIKQRGGEQAHGVTADLEAQLGTVKDKLHEVRRAGADCSAEMIQGLMVGVERLSQACSQIRQPS